MERTKPHPRRNTGRRARYGSLFALLVAAFGVGWADTSSASLDGPIDNTRATLEQWVETRRLISQEKRDWAEGKEILASRIDLVGAEVAGMRAKVTEAEANIGETDRKREELISENESLRSATESLVDTIAGLEERTRALLPRLPAPLRERVKVLSQRLPDGSSEAKASLSERFQNVVGILNEVDKFNRDVTLELEVRDLPEGGSIEVTTMYLGVAWAYYASTTGTAAGYGAATSEGWSWTPATDEWAAIQAAIEVQRSERPASFVPLPIRVY
jgi:hypothetical protein